MFRRGAKRLVVTLGIAAVLMALLAVPAGAAEHKPGLLDRIGAEDLLGFVLPWLERLDRKQPAMKCDGGLLIDPNGCPKSNVVPQSQPGRRPYPIAVLIPRIRGVS